MPEIQYLEVKLISSWNIVPGSEINLFSMKLAASFYQEASVSERKPVGVRSCSD